MNGLEWSIWLVSLGVLTVFGQRLDERRFRQGYLAALDHVEHEHRWRRVAKRSVDTCEIVRQLREELDT